jgi:uncharacterized protein (DUF924 family)
MTSDDKSAIAELVGFWREAGPDRWFTKDDAFDRQFRHQFLERHMAAARRELDGWLDTAEGGLALMLLLDQYPRNSFRGTAHMYATDPLARLLADRALVAAHDQATAPELRVFFHLPFSHSESLADQQRAVALASLVGPEQEKYARHHYDIVARFGRFPHRNPILGRETTPEEQAFLDEGGFAG